ncbi:MULTISPECIES: hypothetical protein [unclassified Beijerinckia]|uniref:hypothetical protein n=1 Tax=unclassified Beijerinckia TaxID=2638183 RepID=UPI0008984D14|nr:MULTISPECIES: hypothetical protein [unclassified Beijerinckia]MDH7795810.1 hypothetical protein [Beijerinckia sp. GAS462]SEC17357.1 hypothetical protein SAMN05443249_2088 [Beijerinckia sp. 28-YEA-48]
MSAPREERFFLYIDILGFRDLIKSGYDIQSIYDIIDELPAHGTTDFRCMIFSDTVIVFTDHDEWAKRPIEALMWLTEYAQFLFYRLISSDVHIRAFITKGFFRYKKLRHFESYYGDALVECYEREKSIKCTGVFLDAKLAPYCKFFDLTQYDARTYYVHVMQHLRDAQAQYRDYPLSGVPLESTGMYWWTAYMLRYLENTYRHAENLKLSGEVRQKHQNAWRVISKKYPGLTRKLIDTNFDFHQIINLDWTEPMRRIGTPEGAWG